MHYIQEYILQKLRLSSLRFSKINEDEFRTDLFTYHLNELIKSGEINKNDSNYTITEKGLNSLYKISHESSSKGLTVILLLVLIKLNSKGEKEYLFIKRKKEPFKNKFAFIAGTAFKNKKIEESLNEIALNRAGVKLNSTNYVGITHEIILKNDDLFSDQIILIFTCNDFELDEKLSNQYHWFTEKEIDKEQFIYDAHAIIKQYIAKSFQISEQTYQL